LAQLDDLDAIRALDPGNMHNAIFDLPEQMAKALKMAGGWNVPANEFPDVRNIVAVGMGGSAIGGDIARSFSPGNWLSRFRSAATTCFRSCRRRVFGDCLVVQRQYRRNAGGN